MKKISLDRLIYNKEIKIIFFLIFFITTSQLFSQIENSKRKIELLPPLSSTLKNLKIGKESLVKIEDLANEIKKLLWKYNKSF